MYQQIYAPVAGSLFASAAVACLPLLTMFAMLGWLRRSPQLSALVSLLVTAAVAVLVYGMPISVAAAVALYGATFSVLTVLWIIVNAIWLYNLTVDSGYFESLRRSFSTLSDDIRIQAIIISFSFGALLEALAGAGTPVAITAAMLLAIGLKPIKATVLALVANTAPVAFGALAVPVATLAQVTGQSYDLLGATIGRQTPIIALFVPFVLLWIVDGRRGLREVWPGAIVSGLGFALSQWVCANNVSVALADVFGSLGSALALVLFLRVWQPRRDTGSQTENVLIASSATPLTRRRSALAYAPYLLVIVIFSAAQVPAVARTLNLATMRFPWPGIAVTAGDGKSIPAVFALNSLSATGTLLLVAGVLTIAVLRIAPGTAIRTYGRTLFQLRWAIPTVLCVLAVAFIMNYSGQTITLGRSLASTGEAFAFLSPVIGWVGVAVTGSDNSASALFGAMQVAAANQIGLSPSLLAAANCSGGVLGKMISPQSMAVGAAAVGITGQEGEVFRQVLPWSLILLSAMCVLVYLQSTSVLAWMLP